MTTDLQNSSTLQQEQSTLIAHEWLERTGGAENVFEQIRIALPRAQSCCLWNDAPERFGDSIAETRLAHSPLRRSKALSLLRMSRAWEKVDLSPFDRVITSSHMFCHQLATRATREGKPAFAYVHTPARYIWTPELDARGQSARARAIATALRRQDRKRTSELVSYAANSKFVRDRIRTAWKQDATVIYPPVAVERIQSVQKWSDVLPDHEVAALADLPDAFVLGASRLVSYKRLDLTMRAAQHLDLPAVVVGTGPHEPQLRALARTIQVPVHFLGRVSDEFLYALYQRATLFVFMAIEDFGIMPVEAMAAGTPVLVNATGGAAESVHLIRGGAYVPSDASTSELRESAQRALNSNPDGMRAAAAAFGETKFRKDIQAWTTT